MRTHWKIALASLIGGLALSAVLIVNSIGLRNLQYMYTLHTTEQKIIKMEGHQSANGYYLTKSIEPTQILKQRMQSQGWHYVQHEGNGYFFEKKQQQTIVTTTIWNHNYVLYQVQRDVVDLTG
ncbi:hypothetical protein J2Z69_001229 [Paenibacillus shirakamiensis]|uniref:Uncharacterized protein n=1 Tax=Paenibacillus shirakamiensis TaxID=1265935 RepID=A0ABS4JER9_9BACL|nr:hypothetical protein [Paenibacillus shirakamiensis]MBP2000210.1 hypothetical protein [Paenibacillus shirakamiensis]